MIPLVTLFLASGISPSFSDVAPRTVTRVVIQRRAVFDMVGVKADIRALCAEGEPIAIEYKRTAGDIAAAVFTGFWYTPIHLRVTCAAPRL
jgi:hypothetical protein